MSAVSERRGSERARRRSAREGYRLVRWAVWRATGASWRIANDEDLLAVYERLWAERGLHPADLRRVGEEGAR